MLGIVTITVGQREAEDVREGGAEREMALKATVTEDLGKDGPEELPEIIEPLPSSESHLEELAQPPESQSSDVGFKKVFKFVGLKFTVKKEKSEKSDTVQLLTVKKDEGEGAGDHQEAGREAGEAPPKESELKQSTESPEETPKEDGQSTPQPAPPSELAPTAEAAPEQQDPEPSQPPEPASSPQPTDTASPFKKFFTQGWAGWRKKTSFRKTKEEQLEPSEKRKEPEKEKEEAEETEKAQEELSAEPLGPQQATPETRLSAEYEKVELPPESEAQGTPKERAAPLATEVFDEKVEIVAQVHASTAEKQAEGPMEPTEPSALERPADSQQEPQEAGDKPMAPPEPPATEEGTLPKPAELSPNGQSSAAMALPENIVSEVDALVSQEGAKMQGSPLKKLFTSSGLKKLSGKKQKGKRGSGEEEAGEQPATAPESPESSASSPEDPEGPSGDLAVAAVAVEAEEGATSDGEKRREGVTPWASFKKMVTPKKRVRRPSESDREEEMEKIKSATLSSTESATSELQDEEPRRKVDSSVSWEALICVGSSKKRARKASSSDDEGAPKATVGDGTKPEEAYRDDQEPGDMPAPAAAPVPERAAATAAASTGQGSASPEQASSPTEGDGVSTWESFKRLVTTRKKSRTKMEEKNEDAATSTLERAASETEAAKEESWVSIRKLIPGRKKRRSDGKPEAAPGPTDATDDDPDVPAVVPLSEYDEVEREKLEAQQETQPSEAPPAAPTAVHVPEELSKTLTHTVVVDVVDGARAVVSDLEERSPSWISAAVSSPQDAMDVDLRAQTRELLASEMPVEDVTLLGGQDTSEAAVTSETEGASEAVTAPESAGAFGPEEATEAEETAEMVSAVSQLSDSRDTTEEATPVQEPEGGGLDQEELQRRTQEVLQAVVAMVGQAEWEEATPAPELKEPEAESGPQHPTPGADADLAPLESTERVPDSHAEGLDGANVEKPLQQASAPDSADTLTDSETNSSTPVADVDGLGALDRLAGTASLPAETQAVQAPRQMPPAPSSAQLQERVPEPSAAAEALTGPEAEVAVETTPHLSDRVSADGQHVEAAAGEPTVPAEAESVKQEGETVRAAQAGPVPTEKEAAVEGGREETEAEVAPVRAEQPSPSPPAPLAQKLGDQEAERPVQSSEAALVLAAAVVEEQVLQGAIKILESEEEAAVAASTEAQAASDPAAECLAVEKVIIGEPEEGDQGPAQAQELEEGQATAASQEEVLDLQVEGHHLVEGALQCAVELLETAPHVQAQPIHADGQVAVEEEEETAPPASAHKETPAGSPEGESPGEQVHPDSSRDGRNASEQGLMMEVASSGAEEQPRLEELILPAKGKKGARAAPSGVEGQASRELAETQERPLGEADGPELQNPALGEPETQGGSTRAPPDTNELKPQEKEEGLEEEFQEGRARRESGDGHQTQMQETTQKQEQDPARVEAADS